MKKYKIMVVDDEPDILNLLERALNIEGYYQIIKIDNGLSAVEVCQKEQPDIIILDVMLPDIDGFEVCRQIRGFSHCPILFLSSKNDELDKILGLSVGGDDYVTKPFSPKEIAYRVKAQLCRAMYKQNSSKQHMIQIGDLEIDTEGCRVMKGGNIAELTAREFEILLYLAENKGRVISRERLYEKVYVYHKPDEYPVSYSPLEFMTLSTENPHMENTVFTGNYENAGKAYGYFIGFPYAIGKHMIYYNGENVSRLNPVFRIGMTGILGVVFLLTFFYGFWLSKHLGKMIKSIRNISGRTYTALKSKGIFANVYAALNELDGEIRHSDKLQRDTERVRREWITNITHDVKTPLSPIKGYAELLANNSVPENDTVQEYGEIILKSAVYTEKLINDLKLTYQFEAGAVPLSLQKVHLVRYIREFVIDIINDPAFSKRDIEFESTEEDVVLSLDAELFRRALGNIIINALTHNPPETKVIICVEMDTGDKVSVHVQDNGTGMSEEEMSELFERYYRGTSTKEKPEGSGLGLAIAKQIVTLHGGTIEVKSKKNEGMEFIISLPINP